MTRVAQARDGSRATIPCGRSSDDAALLGKRDHHVGRGGRQCDRIRRQLGCADCDARPGALVDSSVFGRQVCNPQDTPGVQYSFLTSRLLLASRLVLGALVAIAKRVSRVRSKRIVRECHTLEITDRDLLPLLMH